MNLRPLEPKNHLSHARGSTKQLNLPVPPNR